MLPWLKMYPNKEMAQLLIEGFSQVYVPEYQGFGCQWVNNLKSVNLNLEVVADKIQNEIKEGRVKCPFSSPLFENFRLSPLGLVPKKEVGSFRLIHHLSYPLKFCLNDEVDKSMASVQYASFSVVTAL